MVSDNIRVIGALRELEEDWNARKVGRLHFENEGHPLSKSNDNNEADIY
jgi:hypothetical protein